VRIGRRGGIGSWLGASVSLLLLGTALAQAPLLGRISFPTSGSPAAQPHFLRGVLLLHSFEYDDAIDEFREAQRLDRGFAMAYWGEAMCYNQPLWYNENLDKARATLARLAPTQQGRAAKASTDREKAYLDAVERLYGEGDKATRDRTYADRMAALTARYPSDDEAAAFYALSLLATIASGERNTAVSLKAGAIASAILERNPQHPGAAHYALHAYDDGEHTAMGLKAARIYAKIAPASSHALHMPSHVFLPLGMWDEAVASDEASFVASVEWVKRKGASAAQQDFHSLSWLQYEYLQQGRFAKARELLDPVRRAIAEEEGRGSAKASPYDNSGASRGNQNVARGFSRANHQHAESEIGRGFGPVSLRNELGSMRARLIVESDDWAQMKGQGSFDNIDELFALGLSSVKLGDLARADAAVEHLGNATKVVPDRDGREIAAIMQAQLDGLLRLARHDRTGGLAALARAVQLESARPRPIARPYPIKPAGELYGEALLAEKDPRGAVQQFRTALARTPNRAASLIGLARAAATAGQRD
jgi:tetratricopeptide (TPR) repeat protein